MPSSSRPTPARHVDGLVRRAVHRPFVQLQRSGPGACHPAAAWKEALESLCSVCLVTVSGSFVVGAFCIFLTGLFSPSAQKDFRSRSSFERDTVGFNLAASKCEKQLLWPSVVHLLSVTRECALLPDEVPCFHMSNPHSPDARGLRFRSLGDRPLEPRSPRTIRSLPCVKIPVRWASIQPSLPGVAPPYGSSPWAS